MYFKRFYDDNLAHASYLVGCQESGAAIVIDPARHVECYLAEAEAQGLKIDKVTETHIHADYLSGTRQLAHATGCEVLLSGEGEEDWQYGFLGEDDRKLYDGDVIEVGNLTLRVLHTPGHTPEHLSFVLTDHPAGEAPVGAFTGDFLFVGDVGRPDLLEKAAGNEDTMRDGAKQLYSSLAKFRKLPEHIQVWPAHGAGSACGKALGALPTSVLKYEMETNWAFSCKTEEEFVDTILDGQPEPPKYFSKMKELNKTGPDLLPEGLPGREPDSALRSIQQAEDLIDLRGQEKFARRHPERAIFLPRGKVLPTWAGWLLSYDKPHYLVLTSDTELEPAVRALRSIGLDCTAGYFLESALSEASTVGTERLRPEDVDEKKHNILDVRSQSEWEEGHVEGATHIHLGYLLDKLDEVPDNPVIHCQSGLRSLIALSLLQRAGKKPRDIVGGFAKLKQESLALV